MPINAALVKRHNKGLSRSETARAVKIIRSCVAAKRKKGINQEAALGPCIKIANGVIRKARQK